MGRNRQFTAQHSGNRPLRVLKFRRKILLFTLAAWPVYAQNSSAGVAARLGQALTDPGEKQRALEELRSKDFSSLAELLKQKASASNGANRAELIALEGSVAFLAGQMSEAVAQFSHAAQLAPLSDVDAFTLAMAYVNLGDDKQAAILLTSLRTRRPDQPLY